VLFLLSSSFLFAQHNPELDGLIALGIDNNKGIEASKTQVMKSEANIKSAFNFEKTNVYYSYDQNNLALNNEPLKVFGVQQSFLFPTVYGAQKNALKSENETDSRLFDLKKNQLASKIAQVYYQIVFLQQQQANYEFVDSLYQKFTKASTRKFELGETNYLEKITAESKSRQIQSQRKQIQTDIKTAYERLQSFLQSDKPILIKNKKLEIIALIDFTKTQGLYDSYLESVSKSYENKQKLQKQAWLPNLNFEYFQGKNNGLSQSLYGFQVGVTIPILFTEQTAKSKVARLEKEQWELEKENQNLQISHYIKQQELEISKQQEILDYYQEYGKKVADEIIKVTESSFKQGEIDFFQYIQSIENATQIRMQYAEAVYQYNQAQLNLYYLNF